VFFGDAVTTAADSPFGGSRTAIRYPLSKLVQLSLSGWSDRIFLLHFRGRHLSGLYLQNHKAFVGLTRNESRPGLASFEPGTLCTQVELALPLAFAVTRHTAHLKDGKHIFLRDGCDHM